MKRFSLLLLIVGLLMTLSNCQGQSVKKYNESASHFNGPFELSSTTYPAADMYRIYKKGKTGFKSINSIQESLEKKIREFAKKQGRSFIILGQRTSNPPYVFGNYPRVEIVFTLTDKN